MNYKYLEHTADIEFEAYGETLAKAFENAAKALFNSIIDISKVEPKKEKKFEIEAEDQESLLYDFLEQLLIYKDAEKLVFSEFSVEINGLKLKAVVRGEKFKEEHDQKVDVKAVTYNNMKVGKRGDKYFVHVVVDI